MSLADEMYAAVDAFRREHRAHYPSRIRVTRGAYDDLKRLCVPPSDSLDMLTYSAFRGVPLLVDDTMAVRWRLEYDGPPL